MSTPGAKLRRVHARRGELSRCPTCGDPVRSIFDHVDGCPPRNASGTGKPRKKAMPTQDPKPKPKPARRPAPLNIRMEPALVLEQALEEAKAYAASVGHQPIADAMAQYTGSPVTRQMVGKWLAGTTHPSLGNGLVLLAVVATLKENASSAAAIAATGRLLLSIAIRPILTKPTPTPKTNKK